MEEEEKKNFLDLFQTGDLAVIEVKKLVTELWPGCRSRDKVTATAPAKYPGSGRLKLRLRIWIEIFGWILIQLNTDPKH